MLLLGLASKLGLQQVSVADLSPGTTSLLVGQKVPTLLVHRCRTREYTNGIQFCPMLHRCNVDKRNHFYLFLLQETSFFLCLLDQI
jgi:hypothetical protein